jgi:integrase
MDGVCQCGNYKCLIQVYWKGKYYEFRRDDQSYVFTYDKAIDKLIEINQRIKDKTFSPEEFTSAKIDERKFENMIEKWLNEKESREKLNELSYGTLKDYRGYVKNYYIFFNDVDVREVDLEKLNNFKDTLCDVKIKTRKNIMNALKNFFYWLKERGVIKETPVFPKITGDDSSLRTSIDYDLQMSILLRIPEAQRDIIEFLMETGLRPGEACSLFCEHIDLRVGTARIESTFTSNRLRKTTKQKRKRDIVMSDRAYEIAKRNLQGKMPKQFLFINPNTNNHYLSDTLWRIWRKYSKADVCLYEGTRHSFGSQLIDNNNDISIVKELMGHSSIKTTEKYMHMKTKKLRDVTNSRTKIKMLNRSELEVSLNDN